MLDGDRKRFGDALESRVVESENVVDQVSVPRRIVMFMDPIHAFETADQGRVDYPKGPVGCEAAFRQWMPFKGFVVG